MQGEYLGILALVVLAAVICGAMVTLSWLLGPKKITPYKQSPYECGVAPAGEARERFPVKFYLVAIMFILFDIEVVFLWPWMTIFLESEPAFKVASLITFLIYMSTFVLGYIYVVRVGAIDWDETISLPYPAEAEEKAPSPIGEPTLAGVGGGAK